jgi:hypothetical protein
MLKAIDMSIEEMSVYPLPHCYGNVADFVTLVRRSVQYLLPLLQYLLPCVTPMNKYIHHPFTDE